MFYESKISENALPTDLIGWRLHAVQLENDCTYSFFFTDNNSRFVEARIDAQSLQMTKPLPVSLLQPDRPKDTTLPF